MKPLSLFSYSAFVLLIGAVSCQKNLNGIEANKAGDKSSNSINSSSFLSSSITQFNPNPVVAGDSTEVFVSLTKPAPAGGTVVTLTKLRSEGPVVGLPKILFIREGETSGTTFVNTIPFKDSIFEALYTTLPNFVSSEPALLLVVPRPKSDTRPPLQFFEAENAFLKNVVAKKADASSAVFFSNGAYAQYTNAPRSYVRFDVTPAQQGSNIIEFRYAWRTSTAQQPQLLTVNVNGVNYSLSFPPTASDNSSNLVYLRVNLKAGNNNIYVGTSTGNANGLRLDRLTVAVP